MALNAHSNPMTFSKPFSRSSRMVCLAAVLCLSATGCQQQHGADVVASVNGKAINRGDLDRGFTDQQRNKQDPQPETEEQAKSDRLTILRSLIDSEIIQQRAAKMNLTATNEEVDAKLTEMKSRYTEEQFAEVLKESGRSLRRGAPRPAPADHAGQAAEQGNQQQDQRDRCGSEQLLSTRTRPTST